MANVFPSTEKYKKIHGDYEAFVEKFKPKLTTDDCFTPEKVYGSILDWCVSTYGLSGRRVMRPFYPGGDYENEDYGGNPAVIDNPPFSCLKKIMDFYIEREIDFFLFAPVLTMFNSGGDRVNYVIVDADIIYENGARIGAGFVTNMGEAQLWACPELDERIKTANAESRKPPKPVYKYPREVVAAAKLRFLAQRGVEFKTAGEIAHVKALDAQREYNKAIFGSGFLLNKRDAARLEAARLEAARLEAARLEAARLEAAQKTNATVWELSDREREIVNNLRCGE